MNHVQETPMALIQLFPQTKQHPTGWVAQFEAWWAIYPHKIGKGAARTSFKRALTLAPLDELIDGVARYRAQKPKDCPWCHPTTWLNQERWLDQPALTAVSATAIDKLVPVSRGTPEFDAWCKAGHKWSLVLMEPRFGSLGGWDFPSRWPPGTQPQAFVRIE